MRVGIKTDKSVRAHHYVFLSLKKNAHGDYRYECRAVLNKFSERGCSWRLKTFRKCHVALLFPTFNNEMYVVRIGRWCLDHLLST